MGKVILYEHGCPKCKILKIKLDKACIQYETVNDQQVMIDKGFMEAPKLEVDGVVMGFADALNWIKEQ